MSMRAETIIELISSNQITQVSEVLEIPLTIVVVMIINKVYRKQMGYVNNHYEGDTDALAEYRYC